ncbi:MAG: pteridine reductase [Synechococcaceae cyanobacterium]|jgi:pteridine reductase
MTASPLPLAGRVALVTGAARRVGAAIAEQLHGAGAAVAIHYGRSAEQAAALADRLEQRRPLSTALLPADLLNAEERDALIPAVVAALGGLDLLVNNASSFRPTPLGSIREDDWDELVGSNLKAPLFLSQAALPWLRQRQGLIINIVDIHARRPLGGFPLYCAAKAGLQMLTYAMARELGPEIRVNGVAPGAVLRPDEMDVHSWDQAILERIPLRREGQPGDVAACVLYLATGGSYVNGQVIAVDGGRNLGF